MRKISSTTLVGTVTAAFVKEVNGTKIHDITLAMNSELNDRSTPAYIPVTVFGNRDITVGSHLIIEGEVRQDRWEKDGQKFSKVKVLANRAEVIESKLGTTIDAKGKARLTDGVNATILGGNISKTPEFRFAEKGDKVCNFSIALNSVREVDGKYLETTSFIDVVAWKGLADQLEGTQKGQGILITGALVSEIYKDKEGASHQVIRLEASKIFMVAKPAAKTEAPETEAPEEVATKPKSKSKKAVVEIEDAPEELEIAIPF